MSRPSSGESSIGAVIAFATAPTTTANDDGLMALWVPGGHPSCGHSPASQPLATAATLAPVQRSCRTLGTTAQGRRPCCTLAQTVAVTALEGVA